MNIYAKNCISVIRSYSFVCLFIDSFFICFMDDWIDENYVNDLHQITHQAHTTETGRPRIQREASQLTSAPNVYDFGHVALFVKSKRSTNVRGHIASRSMWLSSWSLSFSHTILRLFMISRRYSVVFRFATWYS